MLDVILAFFWSILVVLFGVPSVIRIARARSLVDEPGRRSIHRDPVPRIGGIAIFGGFLSSLLIFGTLQEGTQQLLAGTIIIIFIGLRDDIDAETSYRKFFAQILAAAILIFVADVRIRSFYGFWGVYELGEVVSYLFTLFVIIGITNALNLLDGIDGLAATIAVIVSLALGALFWTSSVSLSLNSFALAGSLLGFLKYNIYKAKIFMGDTGSLFIGFCLAFLVIQFIDRNLMESGPAIALAILIIPVFDTLRVFILRVIHGRSPFMPDQNHIHHKLIELGLQPITVVVILALLNIVWIITSLLLNGWGVHRLILIQAAVMILLGIIIEVIARFRLDDTEAH